MDNVNNHVYPTDHEGWRGAVVGLGWGSIDRWAIAHSHNPDTAHSTIRRWAHRTEAPRGEKAAKIMLDLKATVAERRRPPKRRGKGKQTKAA